MLVQPFLLGFCSFYMGAHGIDLATYQPMSANAEMLTVLESAKFPQFLTFLLTATMAYFMGRISPKRSKFALVVLLLCAFVPIVTNRPDFISSWVLMMMLNLIVASTFGCWLGAHHALKLASRIARAK